MSIIVFLIIYATTVTYIFIKKNVEKRFLNVIERFFYFSFLFKRY